MPPQGCAQRRKLSYPPFYHGQQYLQNYGCPINALKALCLNGMPWEKNPLPWKKVPTPWKKVSTAACFYGLPPRFYSLPPRKK